MHPASAGSRGWDASRSTRLVLAGATLFVLLVGANLATPLYPLLQESLGLGAFGVSIAFSAYVIALIVGLLAAGHWSDHIGRRAALLLAVLLGIAGGLLFGLAQDLVMLSAGRALQGLGVALATGASSAALRELLPSRPEWASRFTLFASSGGVAAGPLIGGVLSLLPGPTRTPFLLHLIALVALLIPLALLRARPAIAFSFIDESLIDNARSAAQTATPTIKALAPRRPSVSRAARGQFWAASAVGFLSFAVFGFCLSLAPGYFAQIAGTDSRPLIGLLAGLTLAASALSQLVRAGGRFLAPVALFSMAVSVALIGVAGVTGTVWLLICACLTAGAGQGLAFRVVFNRVSLAVEPAKHAQIVSTVYVLTYLGSAVPVLGLGVAAAQWGLPAAVLGFVALLTTALLILAGLMLRTAARPKTARPKTARPTDAAI